MTDRPMIYRDDAALAVLQNFTETAQLEAIAALDPVQVGVKPLEWVDNPDASEGGMLGGGVTNSVYHAMSDGWSFHRAMFWRKTDNLEAAKAAAQADYETRIRSALIATPAPSPDVGGGSTGFGASYQRETDCWVIYSLPRMAPFARMDGFANENVKWAVEALRAAHIRSAPSPDVGALDSMVPRYSGYEIMWAQDGHVPEPQADGEWVLYSDMVAALAKIKGADHD